MAVLSIAGGVSMLMFCQSMMVRGFDRALGCRSMLMFCRSLMVWGIDREDVRSGFGVSIDVDVLSISDGGMIRS